MKIVQIRRGKQRFSSVFCHSAENYYRFIVDFFELFENPKKYVLKKFKFKRVHPKFNKEWPKTCDSGGTL
jgi:hypothetical protein